MSKTPSPVSAAKVACGNGKKKVVIREREYDMLSWAGAKTLTSVIIAVVGVVVAVLTAYYSAEAAQNDRITTHTGDIGRVEQKQDDREKAVDNVLQKLDKTLTDQHVLIRENSNRLIEVQTTQKMIRENLKEMSEDVKKLNNR